MNYRVTAVLLLIVVVFGGYLLLRPESADVAESAERPWFYIVEDTEINKLDVSYFGTEVLFIRDENRKWHIDAIDGPLVGEAFTGTPFLAAGARSPRIITLTPTDEEISQFGLEDPKIQMRLYMEDGRNWLIYVGALTPDKVNNYAQVAGFPDVYLVDRAWGEHMARLITDTPLAPPGGEPTPDPSLPFDALLDAGSR